MLYLDGIKVEFERQGFRSNHMEISPEKDKTVPFMKSTRKTDEVRRTDCGNEEWLTKRHKKDCV